MKTSKQLRIEKNDELEREINDRELVHKGEFSNSKEGHKGIVWKVYTRRKKIESKGES